MVSSMITTLHEMEHHIQTKFGDSALSALRTTWQRPKAGIGQGNGAGPPHMGSGQFPNLQHYVVRWLLCTSDVGNISPGKKLVRFTFVNDTDLCVYQLGSMATAAKERCNNWSTTGKAF